MTPPPPPANPNSRISYKLSVVRNWFVNRFLIFGTGYAAVTLSGRNIDISADISAAFLFGTYFKATTEFPPPPPLPPTLSTHDRRQLLSTGGARGRAFMKCQVKFCRQISVTVRNIYPTITGWDPVQQHPFPHIYSYSTSRIFICGYNLQLELRPTLQIRIFSSAAD